MESYIEQTYKFLREIAIGLDAVREDCIIHAVGRYGLSALREARYLEPCGVDNGHQLYVLCCEGES